MSEELRPSADEVVVRRWAGSALRVVPDPNSPQGRAELLAGAWAREAEQDDWCVDASPALQAGCAATDLDVAAMSASERRAVHLTRQRILAQAVLAAAESGDHGPEAARRERARRLVIVVGSGLLHLLGFVVLALAVADLRGTPRPATHEHLFEAAAVIPIELAEVEAMPQELDEPAAVEPKSASASKPKPAAKPAPAKPSAEPEPEPAPGEPAPYELRGFEFSSEGELAGGEPGGEAWGRPGGGGSGSGGGGGQGDADDGAQEAGPSKPDVNASPRGGLIEPDYPPALERGGVEGSVLVKVWIDEHGHVIKAEVAKSSGHEGFDHNALMAAQRQEWDAARKAGEAVASTRRYRVHFRLN